MYRILTAVGFLFSLFGAFIIMSALIVGGRTAIPYGITFFGMGLVILVSCEQQRRIGQLQEKVLALGLVNHELKNAVTGHGAALLKIQALLEDRLPQKPMLVAEPSSFSGEPIVPDSENLQLPAPAAISHDDAGVVNSDSSGPLEQKFEV